MRLVFALIFTICTCKLWASHIIGGDIYYDYLGNNNYRFFITLYRDCASTGAAYDDPLQLAIYNGNGTFFQNVIIPFPGSTPVPLNFNNPCATAPTGICVEKATYQAVVTIPPSPNGYTASYQRCCRGPNVTNLINPDDTGITLTAFIPGTNLGNGTMYQNSSPRFTNYPPILLCNLESIVFNHSATDPDGDQLTYSLVTPNAGASSITPLPAQTPAPPYPLVSWAPNFNAATPLGPGSIISIHPTTGMLQVTPANIGLFVVGVKVQETRNGIVIGSTVRDFLFRVFDCNITLQALLPIQTQLPTFISYCQGLNVNFVNNSYGGSTYAWDFGVLTSSTDVSTSFQPNFTYPAPGTYNVQLIVNPGQACTDTAYMSIIVNNPFSIGWTSQDSLCIIGNNFDFIGSSSAPIGIGTYNWGFDNTASIPNATGLNVPNVIFSSPGFHTITLTGDNGDCITTFTDSIYIFDEPIAQITIPPQIECVGLNIPFGNQSTNSLNYLWDFGVTPTTNDTSILYAPNYVYPGPGTYTVLLTASSGPGCSDIDSVSITINEDLILNFAHDDSLCINGGLFDFDATVSGPGTTTYWWDFGNNGVPLNSNNLDVFDVSFSAGGNQIITLYGAYDNCIDSMVQNVYVYFEPSIDFVFIPALQCVPFAASFINTSFSDGPAIYTWDYGDGTTSNSFNGAHVYTQVGNYSVGLTMTTLEGCVDTLYLLEQDLITVHPSPIALFTVNPLEVDVCENEVTFTNQSIGANQYQYVLDHNSFYTQTPNFIHEYEFYGPDYPELTVSNEFGCKDSLQLSVMVFPFAIYIPNTFIPDQDGKNDDFKAISDFEIIEWDFSIYNRWGEKVFETDEFSKGWDGSYRNHPAQDGTYTYKIRYRGCEHPSAWQLITGSVRLLR